MCIYEAKQSTPMSQTSLNLNLDVYSLVISYTWPNMSSYTRLLLASILIISLMIIGTHGNKFNQDFDVSWGDNNHARFLNDGTLLALALDTSSGARVQSKNQYLFGRFDMKNKLVPGYSAGTVATFYLSSSGAKHDEIDIEFLGNVFGKPYVLHTNLFTQGVGNREQQFHLWFDPTKEFHVYSILWNPKNIVLYVDGVPVRLFKNYAAYGVPYPTNQPMMAYASIWNGEDWATNGGRDKIDWSKAPFVASYTNFIADACISGRSNCGENRSWYNQQLGSVGLQKLEWFRSKYMIYDYCTDRNKYPNGFPPECSRS